ALPFGTRVCTFVLCVCLFFFHCTPTPELYTLSLHDALPILPHSLGLFYEDLTAHLGFQRSSDEYKVMALASYGRPRFLPVLRERSEEHTSELQSRENLVCRLLLEKKKYSR